MARQTRAGRPPSAVLPSSVRWSDRRPRLPQMEQTPPTPTCGADRRRCDHRPAPQLRPRSDDPDPRKSPSSATNTTAEGWDMNVIENNANSASSDLLRRAADGEREAWEELTSGYDLAAAGPEPRPDTHARGPGRLALHGREQGSPPGAEKPAPGPHRRRCRIRRRCVRGRRREPGHRSRGSGGGTGGGGHVAVGQAGTGGRAVRLRPRLLRRHRRSAGNSRREHRAQPGPGAGSAAAPSATGARRGGGAPDRGRPASSRRGRRSPPRGPHRPAPRRSPSRRGAPG